MRACTAQLTVRQASTEACSSHSGTQGHAPCKGLGPAGLRPSSGWPPSLLTTGDGGNQRETQALPALRSSGALSPCPLRLLTSANTHQRTLRRLGTLRRHLTGVRNHGRQVGVQVASHNFKATSQPWSSYLRLPTFSSLRNPFWPQICPNASHLEQSIT